MKFNKLHNVHVLLLCAAALVACNKTGGPYVAGDGDNAAITLSVGVDSEPQSTKAVITDGVGKTMKAFGANTKIFMVMKSEYGDPDYEGSHEAKYTVTRGDVVSGSNVVTFDSYNQRYWDDAHARSSQLSIWAYAQSGTPNDAGWNKCTFEIPDETWDGIDLLKEYKNQPFFTKEFTNPWVDEVGGHSKGAIYPCIMTWNVTHNNDLSQDSKSVQYQDLMFSNNIANYDPDPSDQDTSKDKRISFDFGTRKFPISTDTWSDDSYKTRMLFYHALSKITIHLKKGEGYTAGQFQFAPGKNIELKGFNTTGTFNIKDGEFQQVSSYNVPKIYQHSTPDSGDDFTLEALVIPNINDFLSKFGSSDDNSRFVSGSTDGMMEFSIYNSPYKVTSGMLFDALKDLEQGPGTNQIKKDNTGNVIYLEAGKHYIFTFTVGKTKIEHLTAELADWETVQSTQLTPSNAYINLQLEERGNALKDADVVDLYRSAKTSESIISDFVNYEWSTGYVGNKNEFKKTAGVWGLTNQWYWPDNRTYYHMRAVLPGGTPVATDETADYISLTSGPKTGDGAYKDVRWGAPMRDDGINESNGTFKWQYNFTDGFGVSGIPVTGKNQIYEAIGATTSTIKFTLFHMMSEIKVTLTTTEGADKVNLSKTEDETTTYATVELLDFKEGRLLLGNAKIETAGASKNLELPKADAAFDYQYGVVPQNLADVKLRIKTPDDNVYLVNLKDAVASSISSSNIAISYTDNKIDKWYPGYRYDYTINLSLKGIDKVGVSLVDWQSVEMDESGVQIK